jgi:hypothetical protein
LYIAIYTEVCGWYAIKKGGIMNIRIILDLEIDTDSDEQLLNEVGKYYLQSSMHFLQEYLNRQPFDAVVRECDVTVKAS